MTTTLRPYTEAEALADAILKPSGSNLRNYTMDSTRKAIITAAQHGIDKAQAQPLEALKSVFKTAALRLQSGNMQNAGALNELLRDIEGTCHAAIVKATIAATAA